VALGEKSTVTRCPTLGELGVPGDWTVSPTVVVLVRPPPFAVTIMLKDPMGVDGEVLTVNLEVPLPGAARDVGVRLAETPAVDVLEDNATVELNPYDAAVDTLTVANWPAVTLTDPLVATVRLGFITTIGTNVRQVCPPPEAVIVK
jgi:hypothetical protein